EKQHGQSDEICPSQARQSTGRLIARRGPEVAQSLSAPGNHPGEKGKTGLLRRLLPRQASCRGKPLFLSPEETVLSEKWCAGKPTYKQDRYEKNAQNHCDGIHKWMV